MRQPGPPIAQPLTHGHGNVLGAAPGLRASPRHRLRRRGVPLLSSAGNAVPYQVSAGGSSCLAAFAEAGRVCPAHLCVHSDACLESRWERERCTLPHGTISRELLGSPGPVPPCTRWIFCYCLPDQQWFCHWGALCLSFPISTLPERASCREGTKVGEWTKGD